MDGGRLLELIGDVLAPWRCAACGVTGSPLCRACLRVIGTLPQPRSPVAQAAFPYSGPVRAVLHRGKFRDARSALRILADLAAERLEPPGSGTVVVPVPLSDGRLRERGYNQARLIAAVVAGHHDLPLAELLRRHGRSTPQSSLRGAARQANVAGAFVAKPGCAGRSVWLLDDVRTTGATTDAAVSALRAAGAAEVAVAVLAAVL